MGVKIGTVAAKTVLTFELHNFAKEFNGSTFSIELRVIRDKKLIAALEILDQAQGIWRRLVTQTKDP